MLVEQESMKRFYHTVLVILTIFLSSVSIDFIKYVSIRKAVCYRCYGDRLQYAHGDLIKFLVK